MRCIRNSHCRGAFAGFTVAVDYFVRKGLISTLEATGIRGVTVDGNTMSAVEEIESYVSVPNDI